MQNHAPFLDETYGGVRNFILPDNYSGTRRGEIETYFESLNRSDGYLGGLVREIDELDEETVVLFFGDHSAGLFDEIRDSEDLDEVKKTRLTPYFIYANYDVLGEKYIRGEKLETVTPNCMVSKLKEVIGLKKSALNILTSNVCEETPVLTSLYFDYGDIEKTKLLEEYELVTYDLAAGKKYWEKWRDYFSFGKSGTGGRIFSSEKISRIFSDVSGRNGERRVEASRRLETREIKISFAATGLVFETAQGFSSSIRLLIFWTFSQT